MTEQTPDQEIASSIQPDATPPAELINLPAAPPPPFKWGWTLLFAIGALLLVLWAGRGYVTDEPLDKLYYPVDTPLWLVDRDLTFHDAADVESTFGRLTRPLYFSPDLLSDSELSIRKAIDYAQKFSNGQAEVLRLRANLVVLLAESGSLRKAQVEMKRLGDSKPAQKFAAAVRVAYTDKFIQRGLSFEQDTHLLGRGWAHDRLNARLDQLAGDSSRAAMRTEWRRREGVSINNGVKIISGTLLGLVVIGLVFGFQALKAAAPRNDIHPQGPSPWSMHEGVGMFVRAVFLGYVCSMGLNWITGRIAVDSFQRFTVHARAFLIWWPVLLFLILRWNRRPGQSVWPMVGIDFRNSQWLEFVKIGVLSFSLLFAIDHFVVLAFQKAGIELHWTEALDEFLLYGAQAWQDLGIADGVLSAPILEELLFRGLLFGGLRRRFGFWPSALISSLCFAGVHYYSLPGFTSVAMGAMVSCYFYERTGSLIPSMVGHALVNIFYFWPTIWFYAV